MCRSDDGDDGDGAQCNDDMMMMMMMRGMRREGDISQREVCAKPAERLNKQHLTTRITGSLDDDDKEELSSLMIVIRIRLQTISDQLLMIMTVIMAQY